jgi:hypothetical protein
MDPLNLGSMPATTGWVHATTGWVHATIGWVLGTIGWVSATVGRVLGIVGQVPVTVGKRRGQIAVEYHTYLTPYRAESTTSDMYHRSIKHVWWTETWQFIIEK